MSSTETSALSKSFPGGVHMYVRVYIYTYLLFARSCLAFISPGDYAIFDSNFSDRMNTVPPEACCRLSHYVRRFYCIVSRPYSDRLSLPYTHFTIHFTSGRSIKYPGLSQPNTQSSGMRRQRTLPHIIHCCHVAILVAPQQNILSRIFLVNSCWSLCVRKSLESYSR